jgi:hypothetical protein
MLCQIAWRAKQLKIARLVLPSIGQSLNVVNMKDSVQRKSATCTSAFLQELQLLDGASREFFAAYAGHPGAAS